MASSRGRPSFGGGGSRASFGAGRTSFGAARTSLGAGRSSFGSGRSSLGTSSGPNTKAVAGGGRDRWNSGRYSLTSEGGSRALTKDPRSVQDKAVVKEHVSLMSQFLLERDYRGPASMKELRQPSSQAVFKIYQFLLSYLMPHDNIAKLEDIMGVLPLLGYPFKINKSMLTAVGSPHAWPTIIASMVFLVKVLNGTKADEWSAVVIADDHDPEEFDEEKPQMVRRMDYHASCYSEFMGVSSSDQAEQEFDRICHVRSNELKHDLQTRAKDLETAVQEHHQLANEPSPLIQAEQEVEILSQDKIQIENYILQMKDKCHTSDEVRSQLIDQLAKADQMVSNAQEDLDQIKAKVAAQPLSTADVERIRTKREALLNEKRVLKTRQEDTHRIKYDLEMKMNRKSPSVEEDLNMYNSSIDAFGLTPSVCNGQDFRLSKHDAHAARPVFAAVLEVMVNRSEKVKSERFQHLNEDSELHLAIEKEKARNAVTETEMARLREEHRRKLHWENEVYLRDKNKLEEQSKKRRLLFEAQEESQQKHFTGQEQLASQHRNFREERRLMGEELAREEKLSTTAVQKIVDHLDHIEFIFTEHNRKVETMTQQIKSRPLPQPSERWF